MLRMKNLIAARRLAGGSRWPAADSRQPIADGRRGFTIIEMLVAMSLIILIMTILTSAFQVGLTTFSKLKAIGDMSDRLRAAAHQIRGDLRCDHFEGSVRLSDSTIATQRVREGFFYIKQFGASGLEGSTYGNVGSYRAPVSPGGGHILNMTVKLRGNRQENFFGAGIPTGSPLITSSTTFFNQPSSARLQNPGGTMYSSQWAEVAYFVQPLLTSSGTQLTADGITPLYSLHRVVRVLIADNRQVNSLVPSTLASGYSAFSTSITAGPNTVYFNTPLDVTNPTKRAFAVSGVPFPQDPSSTATTPLADVSTMLLTDVISFDIQVLAAPQLPPPQGGSLPPSGFPISNTLDFSDVGTAPATYDTASASVGLLAVQITLRVWDLRSQQARQITILQDM